MFRRLEELLRQMSLAARVMGSTELEAKFDQSLEKIKRGIYIYPFHCFDLVFGLLIDPELLRYCKCGVSLSVRFSTYMYPDGESNTCLVGLVWFTRCTSILSVERPPFFFF